MTAPVLGQIVLLKTQSSPARVSPAVVSLVIDSDTANLDALIDINEDWPGTSTPYTYTCKQFLSAARGTGVGEWQEADVPPPIAAAIASGISGLATTSALTAAIAGCSATPGAGTHPSLTLGTARQPSTTRPTRVTISGTWTASLSATGSAAGVIELRSDSASTPTTVQDDAQPGFSATLLIGISVTQVVPWKLTYDVPAGHYYTPAVASGSGFAITKATEQAL